MVKTARFVGGTDYLGDARTGSLRGNSSGYGWHNTPPLPAALEGVELTDEERQHLKDQAYDSDDGVYTRRQKRNRRNELVRKLRRQGRIGAAGKTGLTGNARQPSNRLPPPKRTQTPLKVSGRKTLIPIAGMVISVVRVETEETKKIKK